MMSAIGAPKSISASSWQPSSTCVRMIAISVSVSGAGFAENRRRHGDVADVVQQRRDAQRVLTFAIESGFATERDSQRSEAA